MDCCILSAEEVGQLKHYNIQPNHFYHHHLKSKEALEKVRSGELELVESKDGRFFVTVPRQYYLEARTSAGVMKTIQRVLAAQPTHITPV